MYDELFEAWRKEKENDEIQPLPKGFYVKLAEYIKKIREVRRMIDEKTVKGKLLQKEDENVKKLAEELIETRYKKMMCLIENGGNMPTASLTEEEENIFKEASSQADAYQIFLKSILQGRPAKERKKKLQGLVVVRILNDIPQIVGADMKIYGPFKPEDVATLPEENAKSLIKQGLAMEIET